MTLEPYDHTEREVIAAIERAQRQHAALPLLIGLVVLILLGGLSAVFSVKGARATDMSSRAAVERNTELTRQLTALTRQYAADQARSDQSAIADRNDSRRLQLALCDQVEAIAQQVHLTVPPCPRVPLPPKPARSPSPTPSPSPSGG